MTAGPEQRLEVKNFTGQVSGRSPLEIQDTDAYSLTNFEINDDGSISKRRQFKGQVNNVGVDYLIGSNGLNTVYGFKASTSQCYYSIANGAGWTSIGSALSFNQVYPSSFMYGGVFYFSDLLKIVTISGTTVTEIGTGALTPQGGVLHKDRGWWNCTSGTHTRLAYSVIGSPSDVLGAGSGFIDLPDDVDYIQGMVSFGDRLIVHRMFSVWVIYVAGTSSANWTVRKLFTLPKGSNNWTAMIAPVELGGSIYLLTGNGVFRTNGSTLEEVSRPISDAFATYNYASGSQTAGLTLISKIDDDKLIIGIAQIPNAEVQYYLYYIRFNAWVRIKPAYNTDIVTANRGFIPRNLVNPYNIMHEQLSVSGSQITLPFFTPLDELTYQDTVLGVTSYPIEVSYKSKYFDCGSSVNSKRGKTLHLEFSGLGSPDVQYLTDDDYTDTANWKGPQQSGRAKSGQIVSAKYAPPGYFRRLMVEIREDTPYSLRIYNWMLRYHMKGSTSDLIS